MQDTCTFKDCYFAGLLDRMEQCPNYIETGWTDDKGAFKKLNDCAPRRMLLEIQNLSNNMLGVQKSSEQERNASHNVFKGLAKVVEMVQDNPGAVINFDRKQINGQ